MNAILRDPTLSLRPMTEGDLEAVAQMESRSYAFPWTQDIFRDCLRVGYCCRVCMLGQRLIGYAIMSVAVGESHLLNICVDPEFQGQRLGRRILERMLNLAKQRGADTAFLEVRPSNRAAVALYHSLGFNEIGLRRGYYPAAQGREDALVLACAL
jgi:ribosomal-protein-alanine N-acetyltransferase